MSKVQAALRQGDNIVIVIDNKTYTINRNTVPMASYDKIVAAVNACDYDEVERLVDVEKSIVNYGKGNLSIKDGVVSFKGRPLNTSLSRRLLDMVRENANMDALTLFMENLLSNPSCRAVEELYGFLEKNSLPLTPDGCFLAYKKVKPDYTDIHSGTFDNSIGKVVKMQRNEVDDNCTQTCSTGLHFASLSYMPHFGSDQPEYARIVILKINPRDVVSIPIDYNNQKGRCCEYTVVGEHGVREGCQGVEAFKNRTVVDDYEPSSNTDDGDYRFDADGYDSDGYDRDGYDSDGYDSDGYDSDGYDSDGYDRFGNRPV
jgi:hypothetical protein